jgi:hypothetical protein
VINPSCWVTVNHLLRKYAPPTLLQTDNIEANVSSSIFSTNFIVVVNLERQQDSVAEKLIRPVRLSEAYGRIEKL